MATKHLTSEAARKARDEARLKANALRREAVNTKGRASDRRKPGECRNQPDSIASFCAECMGYETDPGQGTMAHIIETCVATECHLYPWRGGKLHAEEVLEERRQK